MSQKRSMNLKWENVDLKRGFSGYNMAALYGKEREGILKRER